jgi:AcrR family transcriptional regulator
MMPTTKSASKPAQTPTPEPVATESPRRKPIQPRAHDTVSTIISATRSLLRRLPLDDITTTRIARKARVSIGGLYRFFPDKQSIVDAIAVHHVHMFRGLAQASIIRPLLAEAHNFETFDPAFVLNAIIDTYVIYLDTNPDFRAIAFGRHISAATHARESSPDTGLPALIKNFMLEQLGIPNTPELDLKLRVVSQAGERLIAYAFEQPTEDDRDRIIAEMKTMLAGYLFGN